MHTHVDLFLSQDDALCIGVDDETRHTPSAGSGGVCHRQHKLLGELELSWDSKYSRTSWRVRSWC